VEEALAAVDSLRGLRVAVIGESIVDEYAFCDPMGKSGKEPMLVTRLRQVEAQAGGVLAIANHLAEFCDSVSIFSGLGDRDRREDFVRASLKPNVEAHFLTLQGQSTIIKRRYIEAYSMAKMFGVYHMADEGLCQENEEEFARLLADNISSFDVVIVADYGHGLITDQAVEILCRKSRWLAVNTQLNAANTGYHTLSKYARADYACMHEGELRLDARSLHGDLQKLMVAALGRLGAQSIMVTRGKRGTISFSPRTGFSECPSLTTRVVERVGAGDAVLSVSAIATAKGLHQDLVNLLANLAGAQAVQVVGNRASISRDALVESLSQMLPRQSTLAPEELPAIRAASSLPPSHSSLTPKERATAAV
jgi:bifunctional ADP-heptose synthase (sugar kinase/adenylyltransferase)